MAHMCMSPGTHVHESCRTNDEDLVAQISYLADSVGPRVAIIGILYADGVLGVAAGKGFLLHLYPALVLYSVKYNLRTHPYTHSHTHTHTRTVSLSHTHTCIYTQHGEAAGNGF